MPYIHFLNKRDEDRTLLGNKGANLVTITRLGLPVPPGFIISIDAFKAYIETSTLAGDEIEQASEPRFISLFHGIGIDSLSCSPFRVQGGKTGGSPDGNSDQV